MKAHPRSWRYGLFVIGLIILALLIMDFNGRMAELRHLNAEKEVVSVRATDQMQTKSALEAQIIYATSEAAVIEWAYQDGHMVRPGDNPVVPIPAGGVIPLPTPTEMVVEPEIPNWQRWLALFTDPISP